MKGIYRRYIQKVYRGCPLCVVVRVCGAVCVAVGVAVCVAVGWCCIYERYTRKVYRGNPMTARVC